MTPKLSRSKEILYTAIVFFVFFGTLEVLTRFVFTLNFNFAFNIGTFRQLHPTRTFSLKPGYQSGGLSVNSFGLPGPEFDIQRAFETIRILTIGDSVTFSPVPDNYPRFLEERLSQMFPDNGIELINASVPGYSSYEALDWYNEFLHKLSADMIIIYLGWNDMGELHPFGLRYKTEGSYREITVVGSLMKYLYFMRTPYFVLGHLERRMPVDTSELSDEQERILAEFYPRHYEDNMRTLVQRGKADGSAVCLLSLPGLITYPPTEQELSTIHFPRNLRKHLNAYRAIYGKYLHVLEKVAAETQTPIIYLDEVIDTPEERLIFRDTMHITESGAVVFGNYIAGAIRPKVAELAAVRNGARSSAQ